jgi:hypothetical protein
MAQNNSIYKYKDVDMFIYFWKYSQGGGRANIALSMLNVCAFIACRFAPLQAPGTCVDAPQALGAY